MTRVCSDLNARDRLWETFGRKRSACGLRIVFNAALCAEIKTNQTP